MKISILMGSPNKNGSTSLLVNESHYKTLVRYINFEDKGMVLGYGCGSPGMTKRSRYPEEAYRLGRMM